MKAKISPEQLAAIQADPDRPLRIEDPEGGSAYFLLGEDLGNKAILALEEKRLWQGLQESVRQADRGDTISLEKADEQLRDELPFLNRK